MSSSIGRNDQCWCGSGLKYKKCHLNRSDQEPYNTWEVEKALNKVFNIKLCLAPEPMQKDCSSVFSKSHTVPSQCLNYISRNGHVYSFIHDYLKLQGHFLPKLTGINNASTFNGFCSRHDNDIFSKLEKHSFIASQEQCFLLAYRALTREIYGKRAQIKISSIGAQTDKGQPLPQQLKVQEIFKSLYEGATQALKDLEDYKNLYDKLLLEKNYNDSHAFVIELKTPPPIMCSTGIYPEYDFNGNVLQRITNPNITRSIITFTSFCDGTNGIIAFTWLSKDDIVCRPFIDSLMNLSADVITDALIRFFFEYSENLHIKPEWWENLEDNIRNYLINRISNSINIYAERKANCITEDGVKIDNWAISGMKTIGY